jgi:hypothetical protein
MLYKYSGHVVCDRESPLKADRKNNPSFHKPGLNKVIKLHPVKTDELDKQELSGITCSQIQTNIISSKPGSIVECHQNITSAKTSI